MTTWPRAELETAFQHYQDEVEKACATRDWDLFAALFTEDATYVEHAYGNFEGREAIRAWITDTMTANFPGTEMPHFPIDWYVVDEERGRIVCEVFNQLADLGDGKRHGASNITILTYAGDNQWSCEEDVYNPMTFLRAVKRYCKAAREHGTISPEGEAWMATYGG
jgi:uncharacterized protein (TIGR02246 family)